MKSYRVLIVEDEAAIRAMLTMALTRAQFNVMQAADTESARVALKQSLPDIILLDWMLPGESGIDFISSLKKSPLTHHVPIILLTAKAAEEDKVRGLEAGADDYVVKPFSPKELIARMQAVLRRGRVSSVNNMVHVGELKLDVNTRELTVSGNTVTLSRLAYALLHFLMTHPDKIYSRDTLITQVWGLNSFVDERTVDAQIKRLRQVLSKTGHGSMIQTVRGVGYQFSEA